MNRRAIGVHAFGNRTSPEIVRNLVESDVPVYVPPDEV